MTSRSLTVDCDAGSLSAEWMEPDGAVAALVLAHGAGAGYRHANLVAISEALADVGVATLRFNFPFMEAGRRRVDAKPVAVETIAAAFACAERAAFASAERAAGRDSIPVYLGGHSFGGRMASHAAAEGKVAPRGLICLSFPLHPYKRPGAERAVHLPEIRVPMLFLSGTRDDLAQPELLEGVVTKLGPRARLHWLEDADHGYKVRKRVRQDPRPVFQEIAEEVAAFAA